MTEVASLLPPNHTLTSVRHYPAGPPPGLNLVEPGETFATTKEEEWVSKKKTEVLNTKQIETRVKRQVVLEDGKLVEDSGPIVTTNTTEDTETQKHHQTEGTYEQDNALYPTQSEQPHTPKDTPVNEASANKNVLDNLTPSLATILESCSEGKALIEISKKKEDLTSNQRVLLGDIIVRYFMENSKHMSVGQAVDLSEMIVDFFPNEIKESYCAPRLKQPPKGILYNKFHNNIRKMEKCGLKTTKKQNKKVKPTELSNMLDNIENLEESLDIMKKLQTIGPSLPWEELKSMWIKSASLRKQKLFDKEDSNSDAILKEWPCYKLPYGSALLRKDDDKMGAGGPLPLDGTTSSNVLDKGNWIACPNPDGVVREVTEKRVVSREETEEVKEMEDIQHFGDITDEDFLKAVQSGRKDLRHVLRSSDQGRNIVSTGPRLVHESTKSKKVTDTESKRDLSSLQKDGKIVTESQRTTEHEEVTDDPLAEDAPDQDLYKESSERFLKTRDQEDVDYLQNGVNIGHEMRFRTEAMEVERKGEGLGLDDPDFESLSTRLRKRNASRQPQKYREAPAVAAESPLDRKDALTKRPIDFDHEELTRKVETSKWLDHHFGSDSKSSTASTIDDEEKPPKTSFFNVTIKSQSPVGGDRASPRGDRVSPRGERVSPKGYSPGHPQGYSRTSPVLYSQHQAERDEHQQGFYKGISEWTERRQEHVTEHTTSPLPYTRASPIDRQRSPLPDYRDITTPIKYREDISPSPVYNRDIKESSYYYRENKENSRSRDNLRDKYEGDTYRDIRDNRDIRDKSPQPNLRATPSKSRERLNYKETRQVRDTSHFRKNTRDDRDNIRDMDDSFRDRQRRQSPEYYIESPVAYKRDISHNFRDKSRDNYSSMERTSRAVREKKGYRGDYSPERGASPIPPQRRKSEKSRLGEEKRYRSVSREDVRMEEPPPDYAGPPSPPPMPPKDDRKVLQKTRFAAEPAKNKSGNIIGQSIRKLVGKIRSVSAERKAKQRAKRSPSPPSYQQGHIIDSNIGKEVINTSAISSPREFLTGRDEVDSPEMESGISSKPTVQKYYLGEDPFGGSIYGRENKYDGVKPVRISRRTREDEPRTQSSLGGRFSKSSSRLVTTTEDHVSQTLPRRSSHLENNANDSVPTRLAKNNHENTINVSFVNTLSQNNNSAPIKPARTYKTNLSRSKSFNVNSFDLNNSKMYQSNPHLNRLDANVGGLKSPGLISNLSKSQKDLFNHEESTTNSTNKRIFLKGLKDKAPELFKTLHEDTEETSVKPQTHYNNIYEPPTRLKRTPSPTNALRRRGSLSSDYSETFHTTTRSDNPYHPSVTNTTKTISKKTIPSKDGRSLETIESSELKSVTKSSKKPQYLRAVSPQLGNVRESTLKGSNLRENGIRGSNLRENNVRSGNVRERESKVTYFEERNKYGGSRYSSPSPVVIEVRNNHWK